MERYFRSTRNADFPQPAMCLQNVQQQPNGEMRDSSVIPRYPLVENLQIGHSYSSPYNGPIDRNMSYYPVKAGHSIQYGGPYGEFAYNQNNNIYENVESKYAPATRQTSNAIDDSQFGVYRQTDVRKYVQTNSSRYTPYGVEGFGSNKSSTAVIPDADSSIKAVRPMPIRIECAIPQNQESKKVDQTLSGGGFNYGQVSGKSQNTQLKVGEKSITAVGKVPLVGSSGAAKSSSTNKRHLSEAISSKFVQDKHKNIQASGARVFTGPVEKVLKWYKTLLDIGVDYVFEVIAKCINIKSGIGCEKHLLLRDSCGPILQGVFYEIDFFMPKIEPGATVRYTYLMNVVRTNSTTSTSSSMFANTFITPTENPFKLSERCSVPIV